MLYINQLISSDNIIEQKGWKNIQQNEDETLSDHNHHHIRYL